MCAGIDLGEQVSPSPFSSPKNFVAVALPSFADISRRLNVKEEPRGNCVCTCTSLDELSISRLTATAADFISRRATKSHVSLFFSLSLFVFGSKASDKLPRINDESGCRLVVIKNTPRKVKFLGLLLLRNFNLDLLWGRARKSSQLLPRSPWQPDIST